MKGRITDQTFTEFVSPIYYKEIPTSTWLNLFQENIARSEKFLVSAPLLQTKEERVAFTTELKELPTVIPPFDYTYVEFQEAVDGLTYGVFFTAFEATAEKLEEAFFLSEKEQGAAYMVEAYVATLDKKMGQLIFPLVIAGFLLNSEGQLTISSTNRGRGVAVTVFRSEEIAKVLSDSEQEAITALLQPVMPAFKLFTLLNCKNATIKNHQDDKKVKRIFYKKYGRSLVQYKTVVIDLVKPTHRRQTDPNEEPEYHLPLHLRRGHFKDYREGKGLFGRIKGLFWCPATTVGRVEEGIIKKTYEVV